MSLIFKDGDYFANELFGSIIKFYSHALFSYLKTTGHISHPVVPTFWLLLYQFDAFIYHKINSETT